MFFLLIFFFESHAQTDSLNVYYQSLKLHIEHLNKYRDKTIDTFFVEKDSYSTTNLPNIIGGKKIKIIDSEEICERTKKNKWISLISIRPARWDNGKLVIHVIDYLVKCEKNFTSYSNGGGSSFEIIADEKKKLIVKKNN